MCIRDRFYIYIYLILTREHIYSFERERKGRVGEIERETSIDCFLFMPLLGIEPTTFWYTGGLSNQLSHQARAIL